MAFRGTFDHTLDAKNRVTVPSKFRAELEGAVVVARGLERCVSLWTPAGYERFTQDYLSELHPRSLGGRQFRRILSANAFETELDSAGRVMLPATLVQYAGLSRDVVVVGAEESLEVWDRAAWVAYDEELTPQIPELLARIGHAS